MALINKIREKSGLAVGIIAIGLLLFMVGGDLLGPNSFIMGTNQNNVGEIAGEDVSYQEFQQQVDEMEYNWTVNFGRKPTETDMYTIRQQAWELMIVKKAFQKEFEKLGITVTDEEVIDMVQGNNVSPDLKQVPIFQNENTGEFDKQKVVEFLQSLSQMPIENQAQWLAFERSLPASRIRLKYENLMLTSSYVTKAEAEQEYKEQTAVAEINYFYVPYFSVNDSLVTVTEAELRDYMNANAEKYKATESRSVNFVSFPIIATSEDSAYLRNDLVKLVADFKTAENDSTFAAINAESQSFYEIVTPATIPASLQDVELIAGQVHGPLVENGSYVLYKVSRVTNADKPSAKASHILIKWADDSAEAKAEAKKEADRIAKEINGGADFAQMARQFSADPSSSRGGDLGWFTEDVMVEPFAKAVFAATKEGFINRVVETEYGYHLINVTKVATSMSYHLAKIDREIAPSESTRDAAFRQADYFASTVTSLDEFKAKAQEEGVTVLEASRIAKDARRAGVLSNARELVRWVYNEASLNEVSGVFDVDDAYVVAIMTGAVSEGELSVDNARSEITNKVKNQKKAEIIKKKLGEAKGSFSELAAAYGADAKTGSMSDLKISSNSITGVGFAPAAVGRAFSLKNGERSELIEADNGIVIVEMVALTEAPEIADYASYKEQVAQKRDGRQAFNITEAIKLNADITDERYKFY
ncbi:SurA N-terminal domain-containing protein [Cytophagales bacterium LB-30]|uniref:Periplasmic chaperone PpiD n=1 Tax=Shiella aurantiaca TaxID=3058365 RepID=A0ABT8F5W6_9BACT|nr:SurA N-terminal domain-containing protein [Shiella aurantiaca]MDN4165827.1 SurA N-terminal domain-containing protein [Shiella aurantiaca]